MALERGTSVINTRVSRAKRTVETVEVCEYTHKPSSRAAGPLISRLIFRLFLIFFRRLPVHVWDPVAGGEVMRIEKQSSRTLPLPDRRRNGVETGIGGGDVRVPPPRTRIKENTTSVSSFGDGITARAQHCRNIIFNSAMD